MMVKCSWLSSISGPCLISMESARFDEGTNWPTAGDVANQKPPKVNNTKNNFALFIWTPQQRFTCKLNFGTEVNPAFGKQHGLNSTLPLSGWSHSTAQSRRDQPVERVSNHQVYVVCQLAMPLGNRHCGKRRKTAYRRWARRQCRRGDQEFISLRRCSATRLANASIGSAIGVGPCVTVGERLKERHDLVLLRIRQSEHS